MTPFGALVSLCWVATQATALVPPPTAAPETVRIGVLPVLSYARAAEDIFQERPGARQLREQAGLWQRRIERALELLDGVGVRRASQTRSRLLGTRAQEALEIGRERYTIGLERYRGLEVEPAAQHLHRAHELFEASFVDVTEPREVADVALYEGLATIESGPQSRAHVAFRRMWTLDPSRSFDRGYYPSTTEEALEVALEDLLATPDLAALRWPSDRLQALSALARVDVWFTATIRGPLDAPKLHVRGYDARRRTTTLDETLTLDSDTSDRLARALSAWHACHVDLSTPPLVRPRPRPRWYVDVSYAHTLMLYHRNTRDLFQSPGLSIGVTWEGLDFLHGYAQFSYMGSVPDPNGDLLKPFVATRFAAGAGLTGGSRRFRGFFRLGLEVAVSLTDIAMTQDVQCKHWGTSHPLCHDANVFVDASPGTWFGAVFGVGMRWALVDAWYLTSVLELASYFADAESELIDDLNFPLSMSVGVGTRF